MGGGGVKDGSMGLCVDRRGWGIEGCGEILKAEARTKAVAEQTGTY